MTIGTASATRSWLIDRSTGPMDAGAIAFHAPSHVFQAPGGGENQLVQTGRHLESKGHGIRLFNAWTDRLEDARLLHLFGMSREGLEWARVARARRVPVVLSPISWIEPRAIAAMAPSRLVGAWRLAKWSVKCAAPRWPTWRRALLSLADAVLPNSRAEADQLVRFFGADRARVHVVPNGVSPRFEEAEPEQFRAHLAAWQVFTTRRASSPPPPQPSPTRGEGVLICPLPPRGGRSGRGGGPPVRATDASRQATKPHPYLNSPDFVLYTGRIEPRKNVHGLAATARALGLPLVVIGTAPPGHEAYQRACVNAGGDGVVWLPALDHDDPILASAYAATRVFALPSWFETPGLSALEAALAGAAVVITPNGCTREYFGPRVEYARPDRPRELRQALQRAWDDGPAPDLAAHVRRNFLWSTVAQKTAEVYDLVAP